MSALDPHSLTRHNRYDELKQLVADGMVNCMARDTYKNTLLHVAAQNGLKRMSKLFLRHGAEISCRNQKGNTPLHFCYLYGYANTLGAYLESKGADTTAVNSYGLTPPLMAEYDAGQLAELEKEAEDYQPGMEGKVPPAIFLELAAFYLLLFSQMHTNKCSRPISWLR